MPGHWDKATMEAHCKESGVCPMSGKACTWDEATKSCKHNDGSVCDEMTSGMSKDCCKKMMDAHCKASGKCAVSGKPCTWNEATKTCKHNDGSACDEMTSAGAKACCSPEGEMKPECTSGAAKKECCKTEAGH